MSDSKELSPSNSTVTVELIELLAGVDWVLTYAGDTMEDDSSEVTDNDVEDKDGLEDQEELEDDALDVDDLDPGSVQSEALEVSEIPVPFMLQDRLLNWRGNSGVQPLFEPCLLTWLCVEEMAYGNASARDQESQ